MYGVKWFTKLDQRVNFNFIKIKKKEKWKTAFRTRYEFFKYLVIFFGLTNAPVTEQKIINNIFKNILDDYIIFYLNNIFIYFNKIFKNYKRKVGEVLKRFDEYELYLKPEKYTFH